MAPIHAKAKTKLATSRAKQKRSPFELTPTILLQESILNLPSGTIMPSSVHLRLQEVHNQAAKLKEAISSDGLLWLSEFTGDESTGTLYYLWNVEVRGLLEKNGGVAELRERARRWKSHCDAGSAILHSMEKAIEGWVVEPFVLTKLLQWMAPIQLSTGYLRFLGLIAGSEILRVRTTGQWAQCEKGLKEVVEADLEEVRMSHRVHIF